MTGGSGRSASVHVVRVNLRDVRPAVWRRLEVPSAITLGQFHRVLQAAFDWSGDHLHDFQVRGTRYQAVRSGMFGPGVFGEPARDEDVTALGRVAPRPGDVVDYTYDFGDDWEHRIEVESVRPARPDVQYPACTEGAGLAPEEDTGRTRQGQFGESARRRLNDHLRGLGAVDGRHLPVEEVLADPHFSGLFPDLVEDDEGECPCGCGEVSGGLAAPVLPMLRPVPDAELAGLAARSPLVRRAVDLATWIGPGRALTPSRLLRPADAVRAVAELGLAEVLLPRPDSDGVAPAAEVAPAAGGDDASPGARRRRAGAPSRRPAQQVLQLFGDAYHPPLPDGAPGRPPEHPRDRLPAPHPGSGDRHVRSAKDLPSLQPLWTGCLAAGLIEIRGGKAYPGPGLALWQAAADPAAQVEGWCALLGGYLRARDDAARAGRDRLSRIRRRVLPLGIPLLYGMAREPVPVGALSLALAELDQAEDAFGPSLLLRLPATSVELDRAMRDWLVAGVVEPVDLSGADTAELVGRVAELKAEVEERLALVAAAPAAGPDRAAEPRAVLPGVAEVLLDTPAIQLTPLGGYGLARMLTAHGWRVPQAGACLDVEPGELLDRLAEYLPPDAMQEASGWLAARGEGWAPAVEQVIWSAAVKGEDGPVRRSMLPTVLGAAGPRVEPLVDAGARDPWLAPVLAVARYLLGLGPEPSVGQLLWLTVDALSVELGDPDGFAEELEDSPLEELLARSSGLADVVTLGHPRAREVLQAAAPQLEDPDLGRALRKALSGRSGNPPLRAGARRSPGGSPGRGKGTGGGRGRR